VPPYSRSFFLKVDAGFVVQPRELALHISMQRGPEMVVDPASEIDEFCNPAASRLLPGNAPAKADAQ
jgi:hypothetical protein